MRWQRAIYVCLLLEKTTLKRIGRVRWGTTRLFLTNLDSIEKNERHSTPVVVKGLMARAGICFVVERKLLPSLIYSK